MGFRVEETMESAIRNSGKHEMSDIPKSPTPTRLNAVEGPGESEDERDGDILEFVMLLEISESSEAMKGLLLKILSSNKADQLTPYLKDRSSDRQRRPKKSGRRSSIGKRSDHSDQNNGSSHNLRNGTKKPTRNNKSIDQGSRTMTSSALTKLNSGPMSPASLRRSRQSEGCLQRSKRDIVRDSPGQKSRLLTSSSLLQLRTARRGDGSKRRPMDQDDMQIQKQNSSWDPVPGTIKMNKRASTGSFMRPVPLSPDGNSKNASWGSAVSPSRGVDAIEKLRQKALLMKAANERRSSLGTKKKNNSDHSNSDLSRSSRSGLSSKKRNGSEHSKHEEKRPTAELDTSQNNGFAQFEFGQVAYRENTVCLNDLVDNMNFGKESIRSINKGEDTKQFNGESAPEKKGLRKYLKKQLTKKGIGKDKQSGASDSFNEKYASLCDENKFHAGDVSITS